MPRPPILLARAAGLALLLATASGASLAAAPEGPLPSLAVSSDQERPPDAAFMSAPAINPSTAELRSASQAPVAGEGVGIAVGEPAPSYETLGDAAAAGVNPLATVSPGEGLGASAPASTSLVSRLWPYGLAALLFGALCVIGYVVVAPRAQPPDAR